METSIEASTVVFSGTVPRLTAVTPPCDVPSTLTPGAAMVELTKAAPVSVPATGKSDDESTSLATSGGGLPWNDAAGKNASRTPLPRSNPLASLTVVGTGVQLMPPSVENCHTPLV